MYIAMNRFHIVPGNEQEFIDIWANRDSHLDTVPGFREFRLLQGETNEEYTLFSSHAVWETEDDFRNWTKSEAFRKAHAGAGGNRNIYVGHPNFEGFKVVL